MECKVVGSNPPSDADPNADPDPNPTSHPRYHAFYMDKFITRSMVLVVPNPDPIGTRLTLTVTATLAPTLNTCLNCEGCHGTPVMSGLGLEGSGWGKGYQDQEQG